MKKNRTYTAWVVRDAANRKYLDTPTYTGRRNGVWGRFAEAHVFSTAARAQSCASNINRRGPGSKDATVVAVRMRRIG